MKAIEDEYNEGTMNTFYCGKCLAMFEEECVCDDNDEPDDFQPCDECDLPDACADFGCAIKMAIKSKPIRF